MRADLPGSPVQAQHLQLPADQQLRGENEEELVQEGVQQRLRIVPLCLKVPARRLQHSRACTA